MKNPKEIQIQDINTSLFKGLNPKYGTQDLISLQNLHKIQSEIEKNGLINDLSPLQICSETLRFYRLLTTCNHKLIEFCENEGQNLSDLRKLKHFQPIIVNILWNNRISACLGRSWIKNQSRREGCIEFSSVLWPRMGPVLQHNIFIHEICHILAELQKTDCDHGKIWKDWMEFFGAEPLEEYKIEG